MQNSQKRFFTSLFINLGSLDTMSEAIVKYIVSDSRMNYLVNESHNDTYFNYYIDNYGYDERLLGQKRLVSAILKKYWNFYTFSQLPLIW